MSGVTSCRQCGCSEIDIDPSLGNAVCTKCGFVLEESIIVSEVTFEEDAHGGASAVGQFVSAESRGGGIVGAAAGFHSGIGKESREITLRSAKKRITDVAQHLRLNQHCIEVAFNFFKMALHKQITKGRKHPLTIAACVYMTCRMEGTPHLLIDFSDVVQMDVYALGRAYLQISRALFINIPSVDPCMYILRFAHKFNLGAKTHEVSVTALRLVQRMKRDWIHFGRRPSGLCGAALLIAARIHGFSRTVHDIINVVKVHETTLRRRLVEFGETPSSSLTMEEFMTVDLEEEHDPPAFKAARVKDRDHLQKLLEDGAVTGEFDVLQDKIETELERRFSKRKEKATKRPHDEMQEEEVESNAIDALTRSSINELLLDSGNVPPVDPSLPLIPTTHPIKAEIRLKKEVKREVKPESGALDPDRILMPPPSSERIGIHDFELESTVDKDEEEEDDNEGGDYDEEEEIEGGELDLTGIDDQEIDGYIMNDVEAERKRVMWERLNNEYIVGQEQKRIRMEEDIKMGKFDTKKIKKEKGGGGGSNKKGDNFQAKSAGEAIKIMLEKKLSSKINYEVLKSLTTKLEPQGSESNPPVPSSQILEPEKDEFVTVIESGPVIPRRNTIVKDEPGKGGGGGPRTPRKRYKSESESIESLKSSSSVSVMIDPDTKCIVLKPIKADGGERELSRSTSFTAEPPVVIDEPELVVESGPVVVESGPVPVTYDPTATEEEVDETYEDEEEDEGESGLSASQLLNQFRGEASEGYEDYY